MIYGRKYKTIKHQDDSSSPSSVRVERLRDTKIDWTNYAIIAEKEKNVTQQHSSNSILNGADIWGE